MVVCIERQHSYRFVCCRPDTCRDLKYIHIEIGNDIEGMRPAGRKQNSAAQSIVCDAQTTAVRAEFDSPLRECRVPGRIEWRSIGKCFEIDEDIVRDRRWSDHVKG